MKKCIDFIWNTIVNSEGNSWKYYTEDGYVSFKKDLLLRVKIEGNSQPIFLYAGQQYEQIKVSLSGDILSFSKEEETATIHGIIIDTSTDSDLEDILSGESQEMPAIGLTVMC